MAYDVEITEQPMYAVLNLRGDDEARAALEKALGLALSTQVSTVASKGNMHVLTLGPDEWLVTAPEADEARLESELRAAIEGLFAAVTVVSDMHKVYRLSGSEARDVLAQGTSVDLHASVFGPGKCARTAFAKTTGAVIHQIDDKPTFDVYVERSFVAYIKLWFDTASGNLARH